MGILASVRDRLLSAWRGDRSDHRSAAERAVDEQRAKAALKAHLDRRRGTGGPGSVV